MAKEATEQTMDIPVLTLLCRTARSPCESSLYPSWLVHYTALTKIMTAPMIRELVGDQQWKTHFSREADWSSPSSYSQLYSPWHPENRRPDQAVPFKNLWHSTQNWTNSWKCLSCKLANAENQPKNPGNRFRGTKPSSHWEIDFTEVKPGKYSYNFSIYKFILWIGRGLSHKKWNCSDGKQKATSGHPYPLKTACHISGNLAPGKSTGGKLDFTLCLLVQ